MLYPLIARALTTEEPGRNPQPSDTFGYALEARGGIVDMPLSGLDLSHTATAVYERTVVYAYNGPQKAQNAPVAGADSEMLAYIRNKESSGNPTAQNPRSSAYGLYGFLDSTWATVGCKKTSDPAEQERCAILYMEQRYGGVEGAYYFHLQNNWY